MKYITREKLTVTSLDKTQKSNPKYQLQGISYLRVQSTRRDTVLEFDIAVPDADSVYHQINFWSYSLSPNSRVCNVCVPSPAKRSL